MKDVLTDVDRDVTLNRLSFDKFLSIKREKKECIKRSDANYNTCQVLFVDDEHLNAE